MATLIIIAVIVAIVGLAIFFIKSGDKSVLLEGPPIGAAEGITPAPMPDLSPVEETPAETAANAPQVVPVNVATPTTAEAVTELAKANPSPEGAVIAPAPKKRGGRRKASAPAPVIHNTTIIHNGANVADDDGLGLAQGMLVGAMIADTILASQQPADPNVQVDTTPDTSGFAPDPGQYDSSASAGGSYDSGSSSSYDSGSSSSYDSGSSSYDSGSSFDSGGGGW